MNKFWKVTLSFQWRNFATRKQRETASLGFPSHAADSISHTQAMRIQEKRILTLIRLSQNLALNRLNPKTQTLR